MTKDEALKLARDWIAERPADRPVSAGKMISIIDRALAQPAQEPPSEWALIKNILDEHGLQAISFIADWKAAQPAQEPVAWGYRDRNGAIYDCISPEAHADAEGEYTVPLYTTPQQRPWVGLTGELTRNELLELANTFYTGGFTEREIAFARVIEAAIRARGNT